MKTGREAEVEAIVEYDRAVEVARLLLGELHGPMRSVFPSEYAQLSRRKLKSGKYSIRGDRRSQLEGFCKNNFKSLNPRRLARLYEPLYANGSHFRLPLARFIELVGEPREGVLKGAPFHATVSLSPWGLQTEFPEMHLTKDLAIAFNELLSTEDEIKSYEGTSWIRAKLDEETRSTVADLHRRAAYNRRMCILSCFNLVEAYVNGVAWQFVQTQDISKLSKKKQKILVEGQVSILDKLVKIPQIVTGKTSGPLSLTEEPLRVFRDTIKPFRDSIVHASPFAAPERFGGYEKLSKVYKLSTETVRETVEMSLDMIRSIHRFLTLSKSEPAWIPHRKPAGNFVLEELEEEEEHKR